MKITAPLFSAAAHGTVGEILTFSKRESGQQARFQKKQKDVLTAKRTTQRNKFISAVSRWNLRDFGIAVAGLSFYGVDPAAFEKKGTKINLTGYDFFIKSFLLFGE